MEADFALLDTETADKWGLSPLEILQERQERVCEDIGRLTAEDGSALLRLLEKARSDRLRCIGL